MRLFLGAALRLLGLLLGWSLGVALALLTGWGLGALMAWLFPSIFGPVPF